MVKIFKRSVLLVLVCLGLFTAVVFAASEPASKEATEGVLPLEWVNNFHWRSIGPACMSGRIVDIEVSYQDHSTWWAATASGGLIKTVNNGVTFEHQFDHEATVSIGDIAVAKNNHDIVWIGTGESNPRNSVSWGDGVYKSIDGGETWKNMGLKKSFQIGRIRINHDDPDIVYVGAIGRLWGPNKERGLYKTVDGGKTWNKILYIDEKTGIVDIIMHPKNPDILIVAAYERQRDGFDTNDPKKKMGPGGGIYKTLDGGETFEKLTEGLPTCNLGRIGLDWYVEDPNYVYALVESDKIAKEPENAAYMGIGGENVDVGAKLTEITEGGPADKAGLKADDIVICLDDVTIHSYRDLTREIRRHMAGDAVKVEVSRDHKSVVLDLTFEKKPQAVEDSKTEQRSRRRSRSAFSSGLGGQRENVQDQQGKDGHEYGGLYMSSNGGLTWTRTNSINPRPMYFSKLRVDPSDNNYIYVLGISLYRSKDGGKTFTSDGGRGVHSDNHGMWVDPNDGKHIILGTDGGVYVTYDRMENWDILNHVAIGQFYHVAVSPRQNYQVYGGLQDNGSWGGPSRSRYREGSLNEDWILMGWGDGFICRVDKEDPDLVYFESQNGSLSRLNRRTGDRGYIRPRPPKGTRYRFNWKTPFILSHHNPKIYYAAGNHLFRSLNKGDKLKAISPDLTNTDKGSGTAIAESYFDPDILYVGTDDGALWKTTNSGHEWAKIFAVEKESKKTEKEKTVVDSKKPVGEEIVEEEIAVSIEPVVEQEITSLVNKQEENKKEIEAKGDIKVLDDPISGKWKIKVVDEERRGPPMSSTLTMTLAPDNKVVGVLETSFDKNEISDGKFDSEKKKLTFSVSGDNMSLDVECTVTGPGAMKGYFDFQGGAYTAEFTAKQVEKGTLKTGGVKDTTAEKDQYDWETLEKLVPGPRWVSSLQASRFSKGRIYLTLDGHRSDDDAPYIFVSEDNGDKWRSLRSNLPDSAGSSKVLREDIFNPEILYLGTEFFLYVSIDRGDSWTKFNSNLPTVAVHEIAQHPTTGEIVAGTHGRSLWILDVSILRQLKQDTLNEKVYLFEPNSVTYWRSLPSRGGDSRRFTGENPKTEALIFYRINKNIRKVTVKILNANGDVIKELEGKNSKGLNKIEWDLRKDTEAGRSGGRSRRASRVAPGKYAIVLRADNLTLTQTIQVNGDPEYPDAVLWGEKYEEEMLRQHR